MVNYSHQLDRTFGALADPVRRQILEDLARGAASVSALAVPHGMSLPAFLKHVRVLREAGLIAAVKRGRVRECSLIPGAMGAARDWLTQHREFWNAQLDSLERYLHDVSSQENAPWPPRPATPVSSNSSASSTPRRPASSRRGPRRRR